MKQKIKKRWGCPCALRPGATGWPDPSPPAFLPPLDRDRGGHGARAVRSGMRSLACIQRLPSRIRRPPSVSVSLDRTLAAISLPSCCFALSCTGSRHRGHGRARSRGHHAPQRPWILLGGPPPSTSSIQRNE